MQKIHKLFEFPHGRGWIAVQATRKAMKIMTQSLITDSQYNQSRKLCKLVLPDNLVGFGRLLWKAEVSLNVSLFHHTQKHNLLTGSWIIPSRAARQGFAIKISVWSSTKSPLSPPTRTKASRFLPPPSSTRVPHYRFISPDNEDSYSTLHKKKGPEWEPRRGSGQRKVIEKTSIWLWHLHTGEITAVTVDWSLELSSLGLWVIFPGLDLCSMGVFFFFFFFSCTRLKPYWRLHAAHLHSLTLVRRSASGLSG